MVEREAVVAAEEGLHARPAAEFVKTAKGFGSEVTVIKDGTEANAKSPLKLMTLKARRGDTLKIRAEGEDEEAAVEALARLLSEG